MAIANYTDLKTSIGNWLNRSDLSAYIPDFITLAEAEINRRLRIAAMEKRSRSDTASGDTYVALPSGFLEASRVTIIGAPNRDLDYKPPSELHKMYESNVGGKPKVYTIEGTELRLAPKTDAIYTVEIRFYEKFAALSDSNLTNWLTDNAPDLLLYSSLSQSELFLKNDPRVATWKSLAEKIFSDIVKEDRDKKVSGSPLEMRVN